MSKSGSKQPASKIRPVRRSLVELTAAASRAAFNDLPIVPATTIEAAFEEEHGPGHADKPYDSVSEATAAREPLSEPERKASNSSGSDSFESVEGGVEDANSTSPAPPTNGASSGEAECRVETLVSTAAQRRAEAIELMQANVRTALEYVQGLAQVRTPSEFVELWGRHARRQCELVLKQGGALKSLAMTATKSEPE